MIRFLLDTDICISLIRQRPRRALENLSRHSIEDVGMSSISLAELWYGTGRSAHPEQAATALDSMTAAISIIPFDTGAAFVYGRVRDVLEDQGMPIGPLNTLIAAHAIALEATLVTNNEREFKRVPGLELENWMK